MGGGRPGKPVGAGCGLAPQLPCSWRGRHRRSSRGISSHGWSVDPDGCGGDLLDPHSADEGDPGFAV
eukprot:10228867-Alexandrium_andersonii.AAC.1